MAKGGEYEREICKLLSLWLTRGKDDDQLWRSSQSGGRATSRAKRGKGTKGHAGDVVATGKLGKKLLRVVTLEIKRGYNTTANVHTLLDVRPQVDAVQEYERWVWQSIKAARRANTPYWMLIHRRDGRRATVFFPEELWFAIGKEVDQDASDLVYPCVAMAVRVRDGKIVRRKGRPNKFVGKARRVRVVGMLLDDFCSTFAPETVWGV